MGVASETRPVRIILPALIGLSCTEAKSLAFFTFSSLRLRSLHSCFVRILKSSSEEEVVDDIDVVADVDVVVEDVYVEEDVVVAADDRGVGDNWGADKVWLVVVEKEFLWMGINAAFVLEMLNAHSRKWVEYFILVVSVSVSSNSFQVLVGRFNLIGINV